MSDMAFYFTIFCSSLFRRLLYLERDIFLKKESNTGRRQSVRSTTTITCDHIETILSTNDMVEE